MQHATVQPNTIPVIPKEFADLGVKTGYNPLMAAETRQFILGPHGGGKTGYLMSTPGALVFDFEGGAQGVPVQRGSAVPIKDAEQFFAIKKLLLEQAKQGKRPFTRVGFDTVDQFVEMMAAYMGNLDEYAKSNGDIRNYGSKGAGYSHLTSFCWAQVEELYRAGYPWTIVGHIQDKTITVAEKETTVRRPVLYSSFAAIVIRNCDICGTIYSKAETVDKTKKVGDKVIKIGSATVTKRYFSVASAGQLQGVDTGKIRGVADVDVTVELPGFTSTTPTMWEAFSGVYEQARQAMIEKINGTKVA